MTFERMTGAARYDAIRTADQLHLEDGDGARELYNLPSDPLEVDSRAAGPSRFCRPGWPSS